MDSNALYLSFNEIDDEILERSESAIITDRTPVRRYVSVVLIAAILGLLLIGTSATAILRIDSIQSLITYCWEWLTDAPMSDRQTALIDHLSQEIGLSETVNGITVTVDSAMVGDKFFYILLRVEGMEFSQKQYYGFEEVRFLRQSTSDHGSRWSYNSLGLDSQGAVLLLVRYTIRDPALETMPSFPITLCMSNLVQVSITDKYLVNNHLLTEGEWKFELTLERSEIDTINLPDTQIMGIDKTKKFGNKKTPIILTNMVLTNMGLSFQYDWRGGDVTMDVHASQIYVVLANGQEIGIGGGTGGGSSRSQWYYIDYNWMVPVALEEVVAVRIGDVVIPVE